MDADRDGFVNLAEFVTFNSAATAGSRRRGGRGAATRRPRCRRHCACTTRGTSTTSSDISTLVSSTASPWTQAALRHATTTPDGHNLWTVDEADKMEK
ncbi:unnamed protein product [Urochloa humidicola]